ncbi:MULTISPECIES: hypothetical protein [unclassified Kaistella]|uniref:hypothetical protein n=1 Tax=unclassified Kaistella TaxID=2762626 RepID=UPI002732C9F4|nr:MULTISPECIES: hypothetical protein [unclassified Kaistella]MCZ2082966.1 hypothetical protein [Flavobacteriales bacterium]MDP2453563.1 hypothetical protein [Kaistella sp. SH11-4b]MDP2456620.1 hypothetical protein [Kaistella sp. SH40-3]MDP2459376.1 hypothetical protein [Kaistella sp. SH19-2b]
MDKIQTDLKIKSTEFWFAIKIDSWQIGTHIAPRKQFVITLSGKLKFTTSDGLSFIVEPGIVLLAEDINGEGHTWEMIEGHENWHRIYIPIIDESEVYFVKD